MQIIYFHRHTDAGYSIKRVSDTLIREIKKENQTKEFTMPYRRADLLSVFRNLIYVFKRRDRAAIHHITGDVHYAILALIGCKTVLTIHDLSQLDTATNPLKKIIIKWLWFKIPVGLASAVVCISEHTAKQLKKIVKRTDILVIYNSIDEAFKPVNKEFNQADPQILVVGTGWNKNVDRIIEALSQTKCSLQFIGRLDQPIIEKLKKSNIKFSEKYDLSNDDVVKEYQNADLICFCSIYEGFGMPVVEGNAVGSVVVTSNIAPLNEIGADSVAYANPEDVTSIKLAINRVILDEDYRNNLIVKGFSNAKKFNPHLIATKYIQLYSNLVS